MAWGTGDNGFDAFRESPILLQTPFATPVMNARNILDTFWKVELGPSLKQYELLDLVNYIPSRASQNRENL
jgi:hypothetical protein